MRRSRAFAQEAQEKGGAAEVSGRQERTNAGKIKGLGKSAKEIRFGLGLELDMLDLLQEDGLHLHLIYFA